VFVQQSTEGIWRLKIPGGINIDAKPEEIIYYTIEHAYFEECNDAYAKMYGYKTAEEVIGFKLNQLMNVNDSDNIYFFLKFINSGFKLSDGESIEFDKEGNNKTFLNNLTGIIENGKLTHIWGVQRDITKRKEDEIALKESEERYKAFVRHSTEAIWRGEMRQPIKCSDSVDVQLQQFYETGYLAECNDQMARLYGFKEAKDILGARLSDFITINAELTRELSKVFIQNGYRLYRSPSIQLDTKGGKKYFLNNLVGIIENDCVVRVWGSQTDVTEQKRAEKALQVSEQFYKSLFAESVDGAVVLNAEGYIIYAAPSVTNVLGFTTDEMLGKRADDFIYADDIKQGHEIFDNEKSGKISSKYHEIRYTSKQRNIIWVKMRTYNMLQNTSVNGIAVYFTDITERKKNEEELIKSELYLRGTLDATNDGILAIDNTGKVITTNNRFTELWRIPQELIDRKDDQALLENVLDQLTNPQEFISKVNELYKSDRTDFDTLQFKDNRVFERYTTPLMLDQNVVGRVWSFRDITESKKAEEKIKASEDQYRTMVEQASDGIFIANSDGRFIMANTSACIISGYTEAELHGLTIYNLVHPECLAAAPFKFDEMLQPQGARSERKMIRKNGTVLDVEISAKFLPDKRFIAFVRDITERKKVEEAIILSEEKYRTLVEQASDAIFIADINGQLITVNPSACKITQYPYEELIKKTFYDFMIKEDLESNPIRFEDLRQGKTVHIERLMKGRDGIPVHVEIISKLLSNGNMLAFVRNINDRIKAQNEIIKEKNLSDSIINGLPGVFYLFTSEGKFFRWNKNFETVSGYTGDEIKNMHPLHFFDEDEKDLISKKIANVFITGEDDVQANFLLKTNEKVPYYFSGIVIEYEGMPCLMGLGIDFTEKIMVQEKIKESSEKLRQLAHHLQIVREEERKRIGREIHDELGQQLTAIKMDVAWVDKKIPEESAVIKNKLKNIIYLLDESNHSIRRILNELRPSILNDYGLLEALEWLNRQFTDKTGTPVEFTTPENLIKISEELTICIFRIYQEALTNITKYASALKVTSTFKIIDDKIEVSIADDGNGFETTSLQFSKSFGIFGMKERVHSFNGNFDLISSPGNGTKISFSLPYHIQ
jgi:PAS domain S-box-containing protein